MGRRGRAETEALRQQILEAAVSLVGDRGRRGTTVQDVARVVGISKQALMYHYPTKEQLYSACGSYLAQQMGPLLPRVLLAVSQADRLEAVLTELVQFFESRSDYARFLLRELMDQDSGESAGDAYVAWVSVAVDYIRREQELGTMPKELDPEAAISQVGLIILVTFAMPRKAGTFGNDVISADVWRQRLVAETQRIILRAFRP